MILDSKIIETENGKLILIELKKVKNYYIVVVEGKIDYKTDNELFAVQRFQSI